MKVLKCIGFFLLAALVLAGFITAYSTVPTRFEESARAVTIERLEKSGSAVDESYVEASIASAVHDNLHTIYRTAILVSLAVAFVICLLSIRPPHDCGGFNLFNPLALPLLAVITVFMAIVISLTLDSVQGRSVTEFLQLTEELRAGCVYRVDILLITVVIPLMLEVIFRGYIFSFLEKLHFTVAIVLSTAAYGAIAYYCFASYAQRSIGSTAGASAAAFIALFIGFVLSIVTWRLRSSIPAMLAHVFIANSSGLTEAVKADGHITLPFAIIVLAVSLALLVFLPVLFAKRMPIFATDYPFIAHHKRMYKWLDGKKRSKSKKASAQREAKDTAPAEKPEKAAKTSFAERAKSFEKKAGDAVKSTVQKAKKAERSAAEKAGAAVKRIREKSASGKAAQKSSGKNTSGKHNSGKKSSGKKR